MIVENRPGATGVRSRSSQFSGVLPLGDFARHQHASGFRREGKTMRARKCILQPPETLFGLDIRGLLSRDILSNSLKSRNSS